MNTPESYDVALIGNYTKDTLIHPGKTQYVDGGAVNYASHACVRLGLKTSVYIRLAEEDNRVVERMREAGVDCYPTYTPTSTCVTLEYPTHNPDIRNLYVTSTAGSFTVAEISSIESRAAVVGTTLRGEVGLDVIQALRAKDLLLAADVQGFVRVLRGESLVYEPWEEMPAVLACLDILKTDQVEAEFLTGEKDIYKAARYFAAMGPREIVLTHKDGLLIHTDGQDYDYEWFPQRMDGRSGRGDTCLGTYVSMRLSKPPVEAGMWAAAVTSLKMENLGPFNRSVSEVEDLINAKYTHAAAQPAAAD
jgi:sugar/nucleoside kinase (ribokinase family)